MEILVTGGTGFLGRRIIEALVRDRHLVHALARSTEAAAFVKELGARPVAGHLSAPKSLTIPAIDAVIHSAAHFRFAGPRRPYWDVNMRGTRTLAEAAKKAGAKAFVHISAAAVIMDNRGSPIDHADETHKTHPHSFSAYIGSKAEGERVLQKAAGEAMRLVILRPPAIWGPGDAFSTMLPTMIKRRIFAYIGRGEFPCVTAHVDNVVEAALLALTKGRGIYFINDREPILFRDFVEGIAMRFGLSTAKSPSIPYGLAMAGAVSLETLYGLLLRQEDPPFTRTMVRLIGRPFTTSDARARAELGYVGLVTRDRGLSGYSSDG